MVLPKPAEKNNFLIGTAIYSLSDYYNATSGYVLQYT
jgi:hypothetical protein